MLRSLGLAERQQVPVPLDCARENSSSMSPSALTGSTFATARIGVLASHRNMAASYRDEAGPGIFNVAPTVPHVHVVQFEVDLGGSRPIPGYPSRVRRLGDRSVEAPKLPASVKSERSRDLLVGYSSASGQARLEMTPGGSQPMDEGCRDPEARSRPSELKYPSSTE
jgi:hypothetical protein